MFFQADFGFYNENTELYDWNMVYKQNTFLDKHFMIRAISPSSRYVVEGFFCTIWSSLEPDIIDLSRFYEKFPKNYKNYIIDKSYIKCYENL